MSDKDKLKKIIVQLERVGMPVKVLKRIVTDYGFKVGSFEKVETDLWLNNVRIPSSQFAQYEKLYVLTDADHIRDLYHEATHAWFDIEDMHKTGMYRNALATYKKGTKLEEGAVVDDPERVVEEAAGMYVGHRVQSAIYVLQQIVTESLALDRLDTGAQNAKQVLEGIDGFRDWNPHGRKEKVYGDIPKLYNKRMKRRVFGYQDVTVGTGCSKKQEQREVADQKIPWQLAVYCDYVLEHKLNDDFWKVPFLVDKYNKHQPRLEKARKLRDSQGFLRPTTGRSGGVRVARYYTGSGYAGQGSHLRGPFNGGYA